MKYLKDGWLILALAIVFASGLTAIQSTLSPIIAKNQKDKTYSRIPALLTVSDPVEELAVAETSDDTEIIAYRIHRGEELLGYVIEGSGGGYADRITTLVGLSADLQTITGVSVLKQMETPSLGDKIVGPWADQYAGKAASPPLEVFKDGSGAPDNNHIDAISGATISSQCLTKIVNDTIAEFVASESDLTWDSEASTEEEK